MTDNKKVQNPLKVKTSNPLVASSAVIELLVNTTFAYVDIFCHLNDKYPHDCPIIFTITVDVWPVFIVDGQSYVASDISLKSHIKISEHEIIRILNNNDDMIDIEATYNSIVKMIQDVSQKMVEEYLKNEKDLKDRMEHLKDMEE